MDKQQKYIVKGRAYSSTFESLLNEYDSLGYDIYKLDLGKTFKVVFVLREKENNGIIKQLH